MEKRLLDRLKDRFGYEAWRGRTTLDEHLFVRNVLVAPEILPGWQPQRVQEVPLPRLRVSQGIAMRTVPGEMPRFVESIWTPPDAPGRSLLKLETYECASQEAAHAFLLHLLGEFQLPSVSRQDDAGIGDVLFEDPAHMVQLFARANVVYVITNAGRELQPLTGAARQVDEDLIRKPASVAKREAPTIQRFTPERTRVALEEGVPLELDVSHPAEQPLMVKFFSPAGEVRLQKGQLVYVPRSPGEQNVVAYAVAPDRTSRRRTIKVTAT